MIKQLIKRLGLDRVEDYLTEEMRRVKVEVLQEERNVVKSLLDRIEDRIASLGGAKRGPKAAAKKRGPGRPKAAAKRRGPGRPKGSKNRATRRREPGESLRDFVLKTMTNAGGPMKLAVIADSVRELGYKTVAKSSTFLTSVHKILRDTALYKRVKRGIYRLRRQEAEIATTKTGKE